MNLSVRNKFLTSYLYYTTEISYSQQQICDFSIFWIMRIGFAFSNIVAPIHCQQEEERHPVICCTNGTASSHENLYCRPYKIAQHEPNKKYHIHMPSTDLILGEKIYMEDTMQNKTHTNQKNQPTEESGTCLLWAENCWEQRKRNSNPLLRSSRFPASAIFMIKAGITILPCSLLCCCKEEVFHPLTK